MADQHDGQNPQDHGYHGQQNTNQVQLLPEHEAIHPPGEAQNYYDQNQSFDTNSYDDYEESSYDGKHDEDGDDIYTSRPKRQEKHRRKRRSYGSSRSSSIEHYKPTSSVGQSAAIVHQPVLKPGITGTIKGLYDLARKKPHVHGDTVERLELLRRGDHFFNSGFVPRFGGLDREKTRRFREEMDRISRVLHGTPRAE